MEPQQTFSEADLLSAGAQLCYIYTLHASNDPECRPRYVGFTINPKGRVASHNVGKEHGRKAKWIRELKEIGVRAILTIIYKFCSDDLSERGVIEATWIEFYRCKFPDLLNDMGGGNGLTQCSESVRANMSASAKRRCADLRYIEKVRETAKRLWGDPEVRAKSVAAIRRNSADPKVRAKMSASAKLRWSDPKERAKKSKELKRFCADPKVRAKMSSAFKRGWANPESRARMSAENKRRKLQKELDAY